MKFFFHTQTDVRFTDTEGADFPTFIAARQAAIRTCGQMMRDAPEMFWGSRPWSVTVTDETGLIMWEIHLDGQSTAASRGLETEALKADQPPLLTESVSSVRSHKDAPPQSG